MAVFHSVLITGANRGIGLEFARQFLENPDIDARHVIATSRSLERTADLQELQKKHSKLHILKLDVTDFETFDDFAARVGGIVGEKGLTLLINNAGITNVTLGGPMNKLEEVQAHDFTSVLVTNTVAPVMLTKALLPLLRQSAHATEGCHDGGLSVTRAAVINISSTLGSIYFTGSPESYKKLETFRAYGYRESKAALNMATQLLSQELAEDGILVESICPGAVDTDIAATLPQEKMSTESSVKHVLKVILPLKSKFKDGFYLFTGTEIPF